jgi:hypothetical protein
MSNPPEEIPFPEIVRRWGMAMLDLLPMLNRKQRARLERELAALVQRAHDGGYTVDCDRSDMWDQCSSEFMASMCLAGEVAKKQRGTQTPPPDPHGLDGLRIKF